MLFNLSKGSLHHIYFCLTAKPARSFRMWQLFICMLKVFSTQFYTFFSVYLVSLSFSLLIMLTDIACTINAIDWFAQILTSISNFITFKRLLARLRDIIYVCLYWVMMFSDQKIHENSEEVLVYKKAKFKYLRYASFFLPYFSVIRFFFVSKSNVQFRSGVNKDCPLLVSISSCATK